MTPRLGPLPFERTASITSTDPLVTTRTEDIDRERVLAIASDDARQVAVRLTLLHGPDTGGFFAVAGIDLQDHSGELAAHLATATASLGCGDVLLLEATTSESPVQARFGVTSGPGLLDVLSGSCDPAAAIVQVDRTNLFVLPRGAAASPLSSLLSAPPGLSNLSLLRRQFRYLFVSVGPVLAHPDGLVLASQTDGVLLALARRTRRQPEVAGFRDEARRLNLRILAVVLTEAGRRSR